jgi:hypothetical protein
VLSADSAITAQAAGNQSTLPSNGVHSSTTAISMLSFISDQLLKD